jgi:hypothetical protein
VPAPREQRWQLEGDALHCGGLTLAFQRIGLSHWRPIGVMRSWALAPLHRQGDVLCIPCDRNEALWIGLWAQARDAQATLCLLDDARAEHTAIGFPAQAAITALGDRLPLARPPDQARWPLHLRVKPTGAEAIGVQIELLAPTAWSLLSVRDWRVLAGPPPLPPQLG